MMRRTATLIVHLAALLLARPAAAQESALSVELRGGGALPTGEWNEAEDLETGLGFGGMIILRGNSVFSLYAGWDRFQFGLEDEVEVDELDASITHSGARLGFEASLPTGTSRLVPFLSAGIFFGRAEGELEGEAGSLSIKSNSALGYGAAAGLELPVGVVRLRPSLGFRSHTVDFEALGNFGEETGTTVSYVLFTMGAAITP